jgi:protein TonB
MPTAKSQTISIGLHIAAVAMLVFLTSHSILSPPPPVVSNIHHVTPLAPLHPRLPMRAEQHSGGSNRTPLPAVHGEPPPRATRTFIPPVRVPDPKLPMAITVAFPSPTSAISPDQIGDPFSKLANGALGTHGWNGAGDGGPGGIGPGRGGPSGISPGYSGHKITAAQLIYKVEPEFSEEARKAKYSGMVILAIEVDTNGRPGGFRILQSPGLGLDKKAIDAVMQWRFKPGYQDGKPVVTSAQVEVTFRLM